MSALLHGKNEFSLLWGETISEGAFWGPIRAPSSSAPWSPPQAPAGLALVGVTVPGEGLVGYGEQLK